MRRAFGTLAAVCVPLVLSACVSATEDFETDLGFSLVAGQTAQRLGKEAIWVQDPAQAAAARTRVDALLASRYVGVDAAIQVAVLNNKRLQANYADVGLSVADLWQEGLLANPTISVGYSGIGVGRTIESVVAANLTRLLTRERRLDVAEVRVLQAQLQAVDATLALAAETRRAWIEAVAAWESVSALNQAKTAADAAAELARELGKTGAMPKADQAREQGFYAEITGQTAEARLAANLAKERLYRVMGVWGRDLDFEVPNSLPGLPGGLKGYRAVESDALRSRVDLQVARLELEALARSYGLTKATRYVSDLDLAAGIEVEREVEETEDGGEETKNVVSAAIEAGIEIPIFDSGQARLRKAEFQYLRAANLLAAKAVDIRAEARAAYKAYRGRHEIARHYRSSVVPLRVTVEKEAVLTYNGMITNTFDLLADTRAKFGAMLTAIQAKRDFYLADADLTAAINGGLGGAPSAEATTAVADGGGGGH
ncbi:MAG: TolC family protein [Fulvimarina manganoxydans]|uniref:TolC family protein n=1 Tax=Fulvimarina manganoxydans TaxID=937218 RepID=UPI00235396B0|nr:TolC family protein [Fulvimarina manganoxydans]MCK5931038.1 TolC family protein [Fulvimarina manganoxydans]